ncbi:hypothetical protein GJAV_G00025820 [Gymnothorax javanicus]|nr:hypothetical protein GJAV_G00025820 [Gymnothorax javanicus]
MDEPHDAIDFTSEEIIWLENISLQVSEASELSPLEKLLHDMAKPENELEGKLFEFTASVKFGLAEPSSDPLIYPQWTSCSISPLSE